MKFVQLMLQRLNVCNEMQLVAEQTSPREREGVACFLVYAKKLCSSHFICLALPWTSGRTQSLCPFDLLIARVRDAGNGGPTSLKTDKLTEKEGELRSLY